MWTYNPAQPSDPCGHLSRIHVVLSLLSTVAPTGTQPSLASSHLGCLCSVASPKPMGLKLKVFESKHILLPYPVWLPWCSKHHLCLLSLFILKISPCSCRRYPSFLSLVFKIPLGMYSNLLSQLYFLVTPCDLFRGCFTVVLWTKALRKKRGFNLRFRHERESLCVRVWVHLPNYMVHVGTAPQKIMVSCDIPGQKWALSGTKLFLSPWNKGYVEHILECLTFHCIWGRKTGDAKLPTVH